MATAFRAIDEQRANVVGEIPDCDEADGTINRRVSVLIRLRAATAMLPLIAKVSSKPQRRLAPLIKSVGQSGVRGATRLIFPAFSFPRGSATITQMHYSGIAGCPARNINSRAKFIFH